MSGMPLPATALTRQNLHRVPGAQCPTGAQPSCIIHTAGSGNRVMPQHHREVHPSSAFPTSNTGCPSAAFGFVCQQEVLALLLHAPSMHGNPLALPPNRYCRCQQQPLPGWHSVACIVAALIYGAATAFAAAAASALHTGLCLRHAARWQALPQ
jgi:hypothetical protein